MIRMPRCLAEKAIFRCSRELQSRRLASAWRFSRGPLNTVRGVTRRKGLFVLNALHARDSALSRRICRIHALLFFLGFVVLPVLSVPCLLVFYPLFSVICSPASEVLPTCGNTFVCKRFRGAMNKRAPPLFAPAQKTIPAPLCARARASAR